LALRVQCVDMRPQGVELVVRDSGRASAVLRGPLADGEPVELDAGAGASPDVQFNRAWLDQALLRHRVELSAPREVRDRRLEPQSMDLATH
jgi:D-alanyl-D-alanine dipeptidase